MAGARAAVARSAACPAIAATYGRRTHRCRTALVAVGVALGGRPGVRLLPSVAVGGLPRQADEPAAPPAGRPLTGGDRRGGRQLAPRTSRRAGDSPGPWWGPWWGLRRGRQAR